MFNKKTLLPLVLSLLFIFLFACNNQAQPTATMEVTQTPVVEVPTEIVPTEPPTATPVVQLDADILLWAPENADQALTEQLEDELRAYADTNGHSFAITNSLSAAQLSPDVRVVVSLATPGEVEALASVLPQVQFLALNAPGLTPTENLSVVVTAEASRDQLSFLAGYTLALGIPDFRVGVLSQAGTSEGQTTRDAFVTGARFHCGLCNARFAPVEYYPFTAEVTDPANPADWQAAVEALLAKSVTGIFVQPELSTPEMIAYLNSKNITLIGVEGQPNLESIQKLLGVLSGGIDLEPALGQLLLGESVGVVKAGIELKQVNRDLFSDGRMILFERIKQDLLDGYIKTLP
ncbi:MAG TPA: hypothetical protein PLH64_00265 [Anaerolineaceae bacterium]|jgi:hypothetical protein|nr:hypothetical protein [Anaerolineaceae bacterium]